MESRELAQTDQLVHDCLSLARPGPLDGDNYCMHNNCAVRITFDPAKDAANIEKHGVSLALAERLEWDWLIAAPDARQDYGEARMVGYAPIGVRVYCVVFTERGRVRRIISLRKANTREVKRYASQV